MAHGVPDLINIHVGARVYLRRILLGLNQDNLGEAVRLIFPRFQKNEQGVYRIGASRMYDLAQIPDVSGSVFFDDMPRGVKEPDALGKSDDVAGNIEILA